MPSRFLAFDIETAKDVPGTDFNWKPHRPLGICCIASLATGDESPRVWMSRTQSGSPAPQMSREDIAGFVEYLSESGRQGITPLTWNGLAFDFDILAEESGQLAECSNLAMAHIDMMFHIFCEKGFRVSLQNAATGLHLPGKLDTVDGMEVPQLWAGGQFDRVIDYVSQDVRTTLAVALEAGKRRSFKWRTTKGPISSMPLPKGWLSVEAALRLPVPDTSWMTRPPHRDEFTAWMSHTR